MNFSIILPSRGEQKAVFKMLDSFERTTRYKNKIEFLIAIDEGKTEIKDAVYTRGYSFPILFFERPKTKDFTNDYYNWLADRSCGKNIIVFNDDAWMRTNRWDEKILRAIDESGFSIYCLDIPDTARIKYKHQFPCFPCVSRRAFCTLGFVLIPEVRIFPADQVTFAIYEHAKRVIPIRDVLIEHEHIMDYSGNKKEMMDVFLEDKEKMRKIDVSPYIYKILLAGQSDIKRSNKLKRIINILKER